MPWAHHDGLAAQQKQEKSAVPGDSPCPGPLFLSTRAPAPAPPCAFPPIMNAVKGVGGRPACRAPCTCGSDPPDSSAAASCTSLARRHRCTATTHRMVPTMMAPHTVAIIMMVRLIAALAAAASASAHACRTELSATVARQHCRAAHVQAHLLWVREGEGDRVPACVGDALYVIAVVSTGHSRATTASAAAGSGIGAKPATRPMLSTVKANLQRTWEPSP